jgi:hypothetical protein
MVAMVAMAARAEKVRENRLRRMAAHQGYVLVTSWTRDPRATGSCRWLIVDPSTNTVVAGASDRPSMTLDQVEAWLTRD